MNARLSPRYAVLIYGFALLAAVLCICASYLASDELHRRAVANVEQQADRFIGGAQVALNRTVLGVDVMLAGVAELVPQLEMVKSSEGRKRVSRLMDLGVNQNPAVQKLLLLQPDGSVSVASGEHGRGSTPRLALPGGFLDSVLDEPVSTLVVGEAVTSPSTSRPVLYLARALTLEDGSAAAAVAEVDVAQLMSIVVQGADIAGLEVTLERSGGELLASIPTLIGTDARRDLMPLDSPSGLEMRAISLSRLTAVPAVVVARPCLQTEILVTASIPLSAALKEWRRERDFLFGAAAMLTTALLLGAWMLHRRVQRQWAFRVERQNSRATLDQALESVQAGFVLLDSQQRMLVWNRAFHEIFPASRDLTGLLRPFRSIAALMAHYPRLPVGSSALERHEEELKLPDGRVILSTRNRTPQGGQVLIFQDVTEKKLRAAQILEGRAQLQATLDALPDTLLELDRDGLCHRIHAPEGPGPLEPGTGPVGRKIDDLLPWDAAAEVMEAIRAADIAEHSASQQRGQGTRKRRQIELGTPHGTRFYEISVSRKHIELAERPNYIVILRDVTQTELANRHVQRLAFYDVLTGLPNRRLLLELMADAVRIEPGSGRCGAVLFLDLDNFKMLNDALGHAMGDLLLKEASARIQATVRPGDVVARLGGDEFVVVLEGLGAGRDAAMQQARVVGERVIAALAKPFDLDTATTYHRTCSLGIALFDGEERSIEELLKQADIAMYVVKTSGGNELRFFEPSMQAAVAARSELENELNEAIAARQFILYYQSQVDHSGRVVGVEALVRWRHPQRGLVLPGDFIGVAEDTELIVPLGMQILEMACDQLASWRGAPSRSNLEIAVNVSARQFRREDFVEEVQRVLDASGADPRLLKIELTESLLQSHVPETIAKMERLKSLGIRFSMDDFGIGYSSLSYLTQLPLSQLKIDKYFVGGIGRDPKIEMIVQTIIGMARSLDVDLIAEGVETNDQREFLQRNGCLRFQGYLFSKPVAIGEFERILGALPERQIGQVIS